jgi:hypothetical protein
VQTTISDLLKQVVASLLASSTFLQDDDMFNNWDRAVRTRLVDKRDFCVCGFITFQEILQRLNVITIWPSYKLPLGPVVQRWISANPGLKFNLLFVYFCTSVYFKTSEKYI